MKSYKNAVDDFLVGYRLAKEEGERSGINVFLGMELRFFVSLLKSRKYRLIRT